MTQPKSFAAVSVTPLPSSVEMTSPAWPETGSSLEYWVPALKFFAFSALPTASTVPPLTLSPGDAIFVYTDGVTDANNPEGEFYGVERMEAALNRLGKKNPESILSGLKKGKKNPESILSGLKKDVDRFVGTADQFDDLTMLCLEYKGKSGKEKE